MGKRLANSIVDTSVTHLDPDSFSDVKLSVKTLKVNISLDSRINEKEAQKLENEYLQIQKEEMQKNADSISVKVQGAYKNWAANMRRMINAGTLQTSVIAEIKLIHIGELIIVTLPFEAFHEIGLKIKKYFGENRTIILCYANGDYGYLPSKALYPNAEYEAGSSFKFYGFPGPVCLDAEDIVIKAIYSETREE